MMTTFTIQAMVEERGKKKDGQQDIMNKKYSNMGDVTCIKGLKKLYYTS